MACVNPSERCVWKNLSSAPFHMCLAHWQIHFRYAIAHHPCTLALNSSGIEPTNTELRHM